MPDAPDAVEQAVRQVLTSINGDLTPTETMLLGELEALAQEIQRAKREISALSIGDISDSHIPVATDELDAVLAHTAEATNEILDCCEKLENTAPELPEGPAAVVNDAVTRIYEACSFQDITGQRIGKVVTALKAIEARLMRVTDRFGSVSSAPAQPEAPDTRTQGQQLANGPQLPGNASSQAEIDSLLASFD